jgi:hypothetical protein
MGRSGLPPPTMAFARLQRRPGDLDFDAIDKGGPLWYIARLPATGA